MSKKEEQQEELEQQIQLLQQKYNELEDERDDLQSRCDELEDDYLSLKEECESLIECVDDWEKELYIYTVKKTLVVEDLVESLSRRTKEMKKIIYE